MSYMSACEVCYEEEAHWVCNTCGKIIGHGCVKTHGPKKKAYCKSCHELIGFV